MGIAEQISAALAGRASQRPFVDDLAKAWKELDDSFSTLTAAAAELARNAAGVRSPSGAQADVLREVTRYLDRQADWQERATALNELIRSRGEILRVLDERVHRETVNIGVIGMTTAGKSTLLRKLSGLTDEQIPSNNYSSSTATPSRIFHEPGGAQGRAILQLHTWESFRDDFLRPLHRLAKLSDPTGWSLADFRAFRYPDEPGRVEAGLAEAEKYRIRLRDAQQSLNSYLRLLKGGSEEIRLDQLRQFVAYPADTDVRRDRRPYHAVQSVDIFCRFPEAGAVRLGLVDLPGSGEAGLDVHGRFLTDLRNYTDFLFIVKRPTAMAATDADWGEAQLADEASAGVSRRDFVREIVNRDRSIGDDFFGAALARVRDKDRRLGIDHLVCDLSAPAEEVNSEILAPTLDHLADRLAYMDRDAVVHVLKDLTTVAQQALGLSSELVREIGAWRATLPSEEKQRRDRFKELRDKVGDQLAQVRDGYDALVLAGGQVAIAELRQEIERASRETREWLASGIGAASAEDWMTRYRRALATGHEGDMLDVEYNKARQHIVAVFGRIDASLALAVERLWTSVTDALRAELTDQVVPPGLDGRTTLTAFAELAATEGAADLSAAAKRLLDLQKDYGSIFLRVGRPVVRQISKSMYQLGQVGQNPAVQSQAVQSQGAVINGLAPTVSWWESQIQSEVSAGSAGGSGPGPDASHGPLPGSQAAGSLHPEAAEQYRRLTSVISDTIASLESEFNGEARRTLLVLAAAVDLFKESATSAPNIEVDFEQLCAKVQREIWPADFDDGAVAVLADLAALAQRARDTSAAAGRVADAGKVRP